ncbi:ATP-binding cassette domain-containing protein, partial [Listeria monocytogenes]
VDMRDVTFVRGGQTLVGPVTWQVELDERWVVVGPNGAGKTTLIRMASAQEFPSSGNVFILGERIGATDMRDLRAAIGVTSSAVA